MSPSRIERPQGQEFYAAALGSYPALVDYTGRLFREGKNQQDRHSRLALCPLVRTRPGSTELRTLAVAMPVLENMESTASRPMSTTPTRRMTSRTTARGRTRLPRRR
jgi:hypothetical protein